MQAKISEIFKSVQGEGPYQGQPQVFVRFFGCNLSCSYCDTPQKYFRNWTQEEVQTEINRCQDYHSVSLTGGEPLLQAGFIRGLAAKLKRSGVKVYLETNGTLVRQLEQVIDQVDIVSMDFKLPSSTRGREWWDEHRAFLECARNKEVFVKAVVSLDTVEADIIAAARLIAGMDRQVPFILQPEFSSLGSQLDEKMEKFGYLCSKYLCDIRILGQLHKAMDWR